MDGRREEASGAGIERGRKGSREQESKGRKLQGRYRDEGTDQYNIFTNHPTTRPLPLILCYYK